MKSFKNKIIIGIDHGYGNIKTANHCFQTGITTHDSEPLFTKDMLVYKGKYSLIGEGHKEFLPEKQNDEYHYSRVRMRDFQPKRIKYRGSFKKLKCFSGLYATYLHYCYLLGKLPKWNQRRPLTPEMREAWRRLDRFSRQITLVAHKNLNTLDDVQSFITKTDQDIEEVTELRQKLYNKLRRCDDDDKRNGLLKSRDDCTTLLRQLHKEKRIAETIIEDEPKINENIRIETQAQNLARGIKPKTKTNQRSYER